MTDVDAYAVAVADAVPDADAAAELSNSTMVQVKQ